MVGDLKALGYGGFLLKTLDFGVIKLFDPTAIQTHHVVVVLALIEFVDGFVAFEVVAVQDARLFELGEYAVDRGQPDVGTVEQQLPENIFGRHVALCTALKHLEDFQARHGGFEAGVLQVINVHGLAGQRCAASLPLAGAPLQCPDHIGPVPTMTAFLILRAMPMALAAVTVALALSGCGAFQGVHADTFKPYVPEVVQGNVVSREQRGYLRQGLTRAQVRDVLGTPLVTSLFHADRWDYAFTIRRQGVPPQQFHLSVFFQGDVLSRVEGDELPSEVEFVQRLSRPGKPAQPPVLQATEAQLSQYPATPKAPAAAAPSVSLPISYPPLESAPR